MAVERTCRAIALWVALAQWFGKAAAYEMTDSRSCKGFERSHAQCEGLPPCEKPCEPEHCEFREWGSWYDAGGCSGLCYRQRSIHKANNECGEPCSGPQIESKECKKEECLLESQDCSLSVWSDWSGCPSKVDQKYRYRSVLTTPLGLGKPCGGNLNETMPCDVKHPVDCELGEWSLWTDCTATCGHGYRAALRTPMHAQNGGKACNGPVRKTERCMVKECPGPEAKDCEVGEWSEWAGCNFASPQQRERTREVVSPAVGSGAACEGVMKQTSGCVHLEEPRDCVFGEWSAWSECDKDCGGGQSNRKRSLESQPAHGGTCALLSNVSETRPCNSQPCSITKACALSQWSEWTQCSADCDTGMRSRNREMVFGDAARRLSIFDSLADGVASGVRQAPRQLLEDCSGGYDGGLSEVEPCQVEACDRQDCSWSEWEEWSDCTCTCGGGEMRRSRVIRVHPGTGGKPCEEKDKAQIASCNTQSCELCIDGAWGEWTSWSVCSTAKTCGKGYRSRHRDVTQHPNHCGKPVEGVEDEFEPCTSEMATCVENRDCSLSEWSLWSKCSCECYGVTERTRHIVSFPSGTGKSCDTQALKEVEMCNPGPAEGVPPAGCKGSETPMPCMLSTWDDWSSCDTGAAQCGNGQKERVRHVLTPATKGGALCNDTLKETRECMDVPCPVHDCLDCRYGEWLEWGACSKCGGQRYRHRNIVQMPNACGKPCTVNATKQTGECKSECDHVLWCAWSEWGEFTECSAQCGPSTKSRQRSMRIFEEQPSDHLFVGSPGMTCEGVQLETADCQKGSCGHECQPKDCVLSEWSEWSEPSCSQLCDRIRSVVGHSKCGGQACQGHLEETKHCPHECLKVQDCRLSGWGAWSECKDAQDQKFRKRAIEQEAINGGEPCQGGLSQTQFCSTPGLPSPCELSEWSAWEKCSASKACESGVKRRTRAVRRTAQNGGEPCSGGLEELAPCENPCTADVRDCQIGEWTEWASGHDDGMMCSHDGQRVRTRKIEVQPTAGGAPCTHALKEMQPCKEEPHDCKLSEWSVWSDCDKSCAGGQRLRHRQVVQNPIGDVDPCLEEIMQTEGCNESPCHEKVDCVVDTWGDWGACSAECGSGQRQRSRKILQEPQEGGEGCGLELRQLEACESKPCEFVDCLWSEWEEWGDCSCLCNGGQRVRTRSVAREPKAGGKPCEPLSKEEVGACNTQSCDSCVDGQWAAWTEWEKCSKSCGGGTTWRSREVSHEANHCGKPVSGDSRVYASCETQPCEEDSQDCEFGEWEAWSDCTSQCDGVMRRSRRIVKEGRGEGKYCLGAMKQTAPCNPGMGQSRPPVCAAAPAQDCQMREWAEWEACSQSCGGGHQVRHREIIAEAHNGGQSCEEVLKEVRGCAGQPCEAVCEPEDCVWDGWTEWSACDKCGGQMKRFRHIKTQATCGGNICDSTVSEETVGCPRRCHHNVTCMWGEWQEWGACSATCGTAQKSRSRNLMLQEAEGLIEAFDVSMGSVDEDLLQQKVEMLQAEAKGRQTRRLQELTVAFVGGGVTLVVGFAVLRFSSRRRVPQEFQRIDLDAAMQ